MWRKMTKPDETCPTRSVKVNEISKHAPITLAPKNKKQQVPKESKMEPGKNKILTWQQKVLEIKRARGRAKSHSKQSAPRNFYRTLVEPPASNPNDYRPDMTRYDETWRDVTRCDEIRRAITRKDEQITLLVSAVDSIKDGKERILLAKRLELSKRASPTKRDNKSTLRHCRTQRSYKHNCTMQQVRLSGLDKHRSGYVTWMKQIQKFVVNRTDSTLIHSDSNKLASWSRLHEPKECLPAFVLNTLVEGCIEKQPTSSRRWRMTETNTRLSMKEDDTEGLVFPGHAEKDQKTRPDETWRDLRDQTKKKTCLGRI